MSPPSTPIRLLIREDGAHSLSSFLWPCALAMVAYLHSHPSLVASRRVLELGVGRGLVGAFLARSPTHSASCRTIHLTDGARNFEEDIRDMLQLNHIQTGNVAASDPPIPSVSASRLVWGDFSPLTRSMVGSIDLILGADVFYERSDYDDIFATVAFFRCPFLTAYQHRTGGGKRAFQHLAVKWGFAMETLTFDPTTVKVRVRRGITAEEGDDEEFNDDDDVNELNSSPHRIELILFTPKHI